MSLFILTNVFFFIILKYYFEFPEIYSKEIIEEVFNTDITSEDKLFVEYPMVAIVALKDIIVGNFNNYIYFLGLPIYNKTLPCLDTNFFKIILQYTGNI